LAGLWPQAGEREGALRASSRALDVLRELADRKGDSLRPCVDYAEALLQVEPASLRNPALALKYARMASAGAHDGDPEYLDLVAKAQYQTGRPLAALATAEHAMALLPADSPERPRLEEHLKQYRAAGQHE
jgi:hypothetical protein